MLVVIGDLVADLIVLGSARLAHGTDNPAEVRLTRGGSAANVAVAAAREGCAVRFIGRVGDDTLGTTLVRELEAAGVDARVQRAGRTGAIVILVDDEGERTMITDRGAAAELEAVDPTWVDGARIVHVPLYGFADEGSRRALLAAVGTARGHGIPLSLDLSSTATMRVLGTELLAELLDALAPDVVFANADEAALVTELGLVVNGAYVVKRGGDPVVVSIDGASLEVPVVREDVVDSTGAGDAFAAGFLVATLDGSDAVSAARAGIELARAALHRPGAL
ncbi:PfkB family carbohydrate kinase [Microbacterium aoyamense]|uniref:PfkB family carbohydrate kinase n=1 Tax=Microbacterium aoyamense TaxID=344166 RepID=A0ABP5B4X8_9MICO|nr:PfkB family carbohydrate kinase [Microbacterium aoyamense]